MSMDWGEWIRNKREAAGLSKTDFQRAIGKVGLTFIDSMEAGHIPKESSLLEVAKVLGIEETEILLAAGIIPERFQKGVRRNWKELRNFLTKMQKV